MDHALCLFKDVQRIISVKDVSATGRLGEYQRKNGLVCPFCFTPVFYRGNYKKITPKSKQEIEVAPAFCHHKAELALPCENRAKSVEGQKELLQRFNEGRGQSLKLFEKFFFKEILLGYFAKTAKERKIIKKVVKQISKKTKDYDAISNDALDEVKSRINEILNSLLSLKKEVNDIEERLKEPREWEVNKKEALADYLSEYQKLLIEQAGAIFLAGVGCERCPTEEDWLYNAETSKAIAEYVVSMEKFIKNTTFDWALHRLYCLDTFEFIFRNLLPYKQCVVASQCIRDLYSLDPSVSFNRFDGSRLIDLIISRIVTTDWATCFAELKRKPQGFA